MNIKVIIGDCEFNKTKKIIKENSEEILPLSFKYRTIKAVKISALCLKGISIYLFSYNS